MDSENISQILWKKSQGFAHTSSEKDVGNETLSSRSIVHPRDIWTNAGKIPSTPPVSLTATDSLYRFIKICTGNSAVKMFADTTSKGFPTWIAVKNYGVKPTDVNRYFNWIPISYGPSYGVRVWAGTPGTGTKLPKTDVGFEWEFDYQAGILHFLNKVPEIAIAKGIWIEGYVYTGMLGDGSTSNSGSTSDVDTSNKSTVYTITTVPIAPDSYYNFEVATGSPFVLLNSSVNIPATLECHTTSLRQDTNPYRFVAIDGHLIDDGSFVSYGTRFYGPRFVTLCNMEDQYSGISYWRIQNNSSTMQNIVVTIEAYNL